eukprot:TRINITY_DN12695_c0_g1_i1.p1 TRINITY_DN12695_c0_g1~~TRINITY_DN12695_c0_g1_i1.p1  ORF type:complete len:400 (-),score=95.36 TRINITY_DN12695_c0_g1_i1:70-1269(-)
MPNHITTILIILSTLVFIDFQASNPIIQTISTLQPTNVCNLFRLSLVLDMFSSDWLAAHASEIDQEYGLYDALSPLRHAVKRYSRGDVSAVKAATKGLNFNNQEIGSYILLQSQVTLNDSINPGPDSLKYNSLKVTGPTNVKIPEYFDRHDIYANSDVYNLLPIQDEMRRDFGSCAVVGSSPELTAGKPYGDVIDRHDSVFRINFAPVRDEKAQKYTGKRTTVRFTNKKRFTSMSASEALEGVEFGNLCFSVVANWTIDGKGLTEDDIRAQYARSVESFASHRMFLSSIDYQMSNQIKWQRIIEQFGMDITRLRRIGLGYFPSSGFRAVLFAMQRCRSVSLYGFQPLTTKSSTNAASPDPKLKYYHSTDEPWVGHNYELERWIMESIRLNHPKKLRIYH